MKIKCDNKLCGYCALDRDEESAYREYICVYSKIVLTTDNSSGDSEGLRCLSFESRFANENT